MKATVLVAGALLLAVAACSAPAAAPPYDPLPLADPVPAPTAAAPEPPPLLPTAIEIGRIGVQSDLTQVGLLPDGALDTPPVDDPMQAAFYGGADLTAVGDEPVVGEPGRPTIVVGHVDGVIDGIKGRPGVFYRLSELRFGDQVRITREDGSVLTFVVDRVERHKKNAFPTAAVYDPTPRPELRLITCGGDFGTVRPGHYDDNWIVFAHMA